MKTSDQALKKALDSARFSMKDYGRSPVIQDLLYCGITFLSEALKASCGSRPQSSRRLGDDLAAKRSSRLRLYRRAGGTDLPTNNGHLRHV
jgi:hypothetical protein